MPVIIGNKTRYTGSVSPASLNTETTVIDIPPQSDDYLVEGYIDLSALASGDQVVVREYIALDGTNYRTFAQVTYRDPVSDPVVRFHTKTIPYNAKYRVTITQTSGVLRSFYYVFILEVMSSI
jgi:hypothetical protein